MVVGILNASTHKQRFIDSHCHLDFNELQNNISLHIKQANAAGVDAFILPGVTLVQSKALLQYKSDYPQCAISAGLHPFFIEHHQTHDFGLLVEHVKQNIDLLCAVGECGIDALCPDIKRQIELFDAHIELSNQTKLPMIVHHRKSHHLLAASFKRNKPLFGGVIHAFSGSLQQAEYYLALGFKLGVGGSITYPRGLKTAKVFAQLPIESLVLETDSPSMPLFGFQGQINTPKQIEKVFSKLCEFRAEHPDVLAKALYNNSVSVFSLPIAD